MSWGLYGIIVTQMGDLDQQIALTDGGSASIRDYLYDTYHYEYSFRWPVRTASSACISRPSNLLCLLCPASATRAAHSTAQQQKLVWSSA